MPIVSFPPVDNADENGLVAIGGDLSVPSLELAYSQGIFPWPLNEGTPIPWFSPDPRGIIEYKDLHISKSLKKQLKKEDFEVRYNYDFPHVIQECAASRNRNEQTWITSELLMSYIELFHHGHAYSVEVYQQNRLVGGLYGTCFNHFLSGESMFYKVSNASKIALVCLMEYLHSRGIKWLDIQMLTPVTKSLGGKFVSREKYLRMLRKVFYKKMKVPLFL